MQPPFLPIPILSPIPVSVSPVPKALGAADLPIVDAEYAEYSEYSEEHIDGHVHAEGHTDTEFYGTETPSTAEDTSGSSEPPPPPPRSPNELPDHIWDTIRERNKAFDAMAEMEQALGEDPELAQRDTEWWRERLAAVRKRLDET